MPLKQFHKPVHETPVLTHAVQHKMNWFDPEVLNRIAQRMGTVDALLKSPLLQVAKAGTGPLQPDGRELEGQLRKCVQASRIFAPSSL